MKTIKKLLLAAILIIVVTHRHEDYCSDHPHGATGEPGNPYIFGPWMSGDQNVIEENEAPPIDSILREVN